MNKPTTKELLTIALIILAAVVSAIMVSRRQITFSRHYTEPTERMDHSSPARYLLFF